jgi:hypothetical protein
MDPAPAFHTTNWDMQQKNTKSKEKSAFPFVRSQVSYAVLKLLHNMLRKVRISLVTYQSSKPPS